MTAYYNEIDEAAAQWLRNLLEAGHIAPGIVDTRSIEDVHPNDLRGFIQCHFFAGIAVWSHALRRADQRIVGAGGVVGGMADTSGERWVGRQGLPAGGIDDGSHAGRLESDDGSLGVGKTGNVPRPAGPTNGLWADADWLLCRDGRWRPVEPGAFPLVTGAAARVVRLRAYGNAINSVAAQAFIKSVMESSE